MVEYSTENARNSLVAVSRWRHRDDDAIEQLIMPLVVRAGVEEFLDCQEFVSGFHALNVASGMAHFHIAPAHSWSVSASTSAKSGRSMLPPERITATRLPASRAHSCSAAASGAAPAPSATLWVSANRMRIARRISASETVTMRAAPRQMMPSASGSGTRTASPPAIVSTVLVLTGRPAAKDSA